MFRRSAVLGASLAMTMAMLGVTGANAVDVRPTSPSQITDSARVDGPTVVEGQLDVSGSADGGEVLLYAWPANEELHRMEVGESLPIDPVTRAEVSDDGEFALKVEDAEALEQAAARDGSVNLTVVGQADGEQFSTDVGVQMKDVEAAEHRTGAVVDLGEVESVGTADVAAKDRSTVDAYTQKAGICTTKKIANIGNRWVPVGGIFSTNPGGTIDYQYRSGQSSSLGVAVSKTGPNSGFSAGGTNSVKSTATVNFPTQRGKSSRLARTMFHYAKFKTTCMATYYLRETWRVRATSWSGGTSFMDVARPPAKHCVPYQRGSKFTKDKHKQVTWTGAVMLMGVGLLAQTGWSTSGRLRYVFKTRAGRLCGSGGHATSASAYQIVMKQ